MTNEQLRNIVANAIERIGHSNVTFIKQVRDGLQDDGPFMMAGFAVADWFVNEMRPVPESVDE